MIKQSAFLESVTTKLNAKIEELKAGLTEGQQEIKNMHDYYWENYTEMDEYGYEVYDNQQALLHQVNANQEKVRMLQRFQKMLKSPYFGRVDFQYEGEDEAETFYIGIANFSPQAGMRPLIYDWRAPVCTLFYDYDKGAAAYDAPAGRISGEITSKWQYKIQDGELVYAFESDTKIDDEILKQELGSNGDVQLKNIVRTIQREQNQIIRNQKDKILVIQGAAGSGKTSVALHRIAYLLYHDRENLKASDILILSPNNVFSDYISHILPELGEENIKEMSFDIFAYKELRDVAGDCEDKYDYLEKMMKFRDSKARERYQRKQSVNFVGEMEGFLVTLEDALMDIQRVFYKGIQKSEEEMIRLFYFKFQDRPLLTRMDAVMEYLIDEYETLRGRELSEEERDELQILSDRMYVTKDLYVIYSWFLETCGYPALPEVETARRVLEYEDVFPLLYLKYRLKGNAKRKRMKHLIIDEMQDYSYLQYVLLRQLFSCRMTILGDYAQTLDTDPQDVLLFLPKIFGKDMRRIVMNKSYRNTWEIGTYAKAIGGNAALELLERHGKEVEEKQFSSLDRVLEEIAKQLKKGRGFETCVILTLTGEEAFDIYRLLKIRGQEVHYLNRDTAVFERGLTVTTFYLAKGLEFDQVFTVLRKDGNPLYQQAKYISATRALHELYVYEIEGK